MSYAMRTDELGWRAVSGIDDVGQDEVFYAELPVLSVSAELAKVRLQAIVAVKHEAGRIISTSLPQWKQVNLTARAVELLASGDTSSAEWLDIQAIWGWVKSVRAASNTGEAAILAAIDQPAVETALADVFAAMGAIQ